MAYNPAHLHPGDVLLVRALTHCDVLGALIDFATDSPYHHAVLVGDGFLIEALGHVTRSPLDKYKASADAFTVDAPPSVQEAAIHAAEDRIGTPYGVAELLDDAARYFLHLPVVYPWNARRQTCSGLVAYAYRKAGHPLTYAKVPSPGDLADSVALIGRRY